MSEFDSIEANVPTFLREMAERCRLRSRNCFDLAAARDLRMLADDLESKANTLETSAEKEARRSLTRAGLP